MLLGFFDPRGRLSRRAYGRIFVRLMLVTVGLICLAIVLAAQGWREAAFAAVAAIVGVWLSSLAQTARRLHDRDRTAWWLAASVVLSVLSFVPVEKAADTYPVAVIAYTLVTFVFSVWFLIETLGRRGTSGPNRFGPQPLR